MLKILLLLVVGVGAYFLFFKKKSEVDEVVETNSSSLDGEDMVACHECGILSAEKEMILQNGKYYCSKTCLEK